ncbi:MAG TPA: hypothetical protein VKA95_00285 [Nitrososphaeraceae archaeon]|nr:hypothetical protein [Nitrososphaeraceae archaeon]
MVLDQMARGMLEKYIDRVIRGIPYLMSRFRKKDVKDILQYGNEEDFLYGTVYGAIVWGYTDQFQSVFMKLYKKYNINDKRRKVFGRHCKVDWLKINGSNLL